MKRYFLPAVFFAGLALGNAPRVCAQPSDYETALGYYQKQEWDKAVPYFRSAVNRDPANWEAYQGMGLCFYQMGDSVTALQLIRRSLALHPDNPGLRQFADRLQAPQAPPPPLPRETPALSQGRGKKGPPLAPHLWFKVSGGYGTASLGDIARAPGGFKTELPLQGFSVSKASLGNDGIGMKAEAGYQLDPGDALSVDVFSDSYAGFNGVAVSGPATVTQKLAPSVLALECGYYHYWPSPGQRFYAGAGFGYYMGFVSYSQETTAGTTIVLPSQGSFTGSDLGLHAGCGYERQIIGNLGLALSAEFRLAALSNFSGGQVPGDPDPNHVMGLMVDPQGLVQAGNTTLIETGGYRWATVDLTGFEINLDAIYYLF